MNTLALIVLGLLILAVAFAVGTYNRLIGLKNQIDYARGAVEALLKKRFDLIPNLVATVKAYAKHERETLERVTELRSRIGRAQSDDERFRLEGELSGLLGRLLVQLEAYPELKASENFLELQATLNEIEEQLAVARQGYNAAVVRFNNAVEMFPSNLVARAMGLAPRPVFEAGEAAQRAPRVGDLFRP